MTTTSTEQTKAAINAIAAVAEAIRALGTVPSGHLYAQVMGHLSLESFEGIIRTLVRAGLVRESSNELTWVAS